MYCFEAVCLDVCNVLHWHICMFQGRLKPGRMLLVDTDLKQFKTDVEIKKEMAVLRPVQEWVKKQVYRY